ncbi:MAG: beta-ketoacyl-ACP synthase III [Chitinophagaceae bacterium]
MEKKNRALITAVAGYVPEDILTNADFEKIVDTNDEWIMTRTGIKERHILKGEGRGTSEMAIPVARELLQKKNINPEEIDCVIIATISPDMMFPSTSNFVATAIGAKNAWGFDLLAACSGFIYALTTGANLIESGRYKKIIVIGADKLTAFTDYTDRNTCILFGDGAGGVLLEATTEEYGVMDALLRSDVTYGKDFLYMKGGGSCYPPSAETITKKMHYVYQEGKNVFKYAVKGMANITEDVMKKNNLKGEDIAWLVPHQANKRIIDATAERANIPEEKVMMNIERYGNTTAATIPLCLWDYQKKIKKGDNLLLSAFGAGFTWGCVWVRWGI